MTIKILLVCGGGASTGFLVQNMRKVAAQKDMEMTIDARSETQLASILHDVSVVLAAPHLRFQEAKIKELCSPRGIPYGFIEPMQYGTMDGEAVIQQALELLQQEGGENPKSS